MKKTIKLAVLSFLGLSCIMYYACTKESTKPNALDEIEQAKNLDVMAANSSIPDSIQRLMTKYGMTLLSTSSYPPNFGPMQFRTTADADTYIASAIAAVNRSFSQTGQATVSTLGIAAAPVSKNGVKIRVKGRQVNALNEEDPCNQSQHVRTYCDFGLTSRVNIAFDFAHGNIGGTYVFSNVDAYVTGFTLGTGFEQLNVVMSESGRSTFVVNGLAVVGVQIGPYTFGYKAERCYIVNYNNCTRNFEVESGRGHVNRVL